MHSALPQAVHDSADPYLAAHVRDMASSASTASTTTATTTALSNARMESEGDGRISNMTFSSNYDDDARAAALAIEAATRVMGKAEDVSYRLSCLCFDDLNIVSQCA